MARQARTHLIIDRARAVLAEHHPMTVRQVYYRLVSSQVIENTRCQYQAVSNALVAAWPETAVEFLEAKAGGPETLRAFINTALGELWDDEAETHVDLATLLARCEPYGARLPAGVCALTAGVDVQLDRAEVELVGWGRGEESWSIEYRVFPGHPSAPELWRALDEYLGRQWIHEYGISLSVAACAIDSGYHTQAVYDFCRTRYARRIFAIKGKSGSLPVWPKKPTRNTINRTPMWLVGVDSAKSVAYGRLKIEQPGPGYSHFPKERDGDWFEQLLAETLVTTYSRGAPVREWRRKKGLRAGSARRTGIRLRRAVRTGVNGFEARR